MLTTRRSKSIIKYAAQCKFFSSTSVAFQQQQQTHFGYRTVNEQEKQKMVNEVFASVAPKYDIMNDLMSAGMHRLWKDAFVSALVPQRGMSFIDVAGGTGDIAFRICESLQNQQHKDAHSNVVVCDINPAMLHVGEQRATQNGLMNAAANPFTLRFQEGNAEKLPFENDSFDAYTIAFGIRNVTHVDLALQEAYRVLRKGGQFLCLEFSQVTNPLLRSLYDMYSFTVIPQVGQMVTNDKDSYQYLVESIRKFPEQEMFKKMIENAGFKYVRYTNMTFGVVAIHQGFKV